MKTNYFVIAALAATTLFASCNRNSDGIDLIDEGIGTSMKVSINFPRADTRAGTEFTGDANATLNEATINTVDVFIYYTNSGAFATHKRLTAADFAQQTSTSTADVYTTSVKIPTTTGAKSVFAGINLPDAVVNGLKNHPASTLATVAQTMTREQLASGSNFAMFSTRAVDAVFVENEAADANKVTLTCQRMVAKVTVETDENVQIDGVPGILGKLEFAINNFNTKLFMIQGAAELRKDPNWTSGSFVQTDFLAATNTNYVSVLSRRDIPAPLISQYEAGYASENTSEGKLMKEITRATIRATFIPSEITEFANGTDNSAGYRVNNAHGITTPRTFYAVTPSVVEGTSYFFDQSTAITFANSVSPVLIYTDGVCYWNIYLNKNPLNAVNKWDVLRNDFYKCNITRIVAPGSPTDDVKDPEGTPDDDANITTIIEILFWNTPILSNYILD